MPVSRSKFAIFKGLGLAVLSGICFSSAAVIVKRTASLSPELVALYRFIGIFSFSFPDAVKSGQNMLGPRKFRLLIILRGVFGAANVTLSFVAFRYLPLGDASVIIFSVPVFVTVAARIFLKERCDFFQVIAVALTILGIIFTTKLPLEFSGNTYGHSFVIGYLAAGGSLCFNTCRYIVMRKLKTVHHSVVVFTSGWVSILLTASLTGILGTYQWHHCGVGKLSIIILGFISYLGQVLLTVALQWEQAGPVSTMRAAADIMLGFLWQTFLFRDMPDIYSVSGVALVVLSATILALSKWILSLSPESSYYKKLKWMTV